MTILYCNIYLALKYLEKMFSFVNSIILTTMINCIIVCATRGHSKSLEVQVALHSPQHNVYTKLMHFIQKCLVIYFLWSIDSSVPQRL